MSFSFFILEGLKSLSVAVGGILFLLCSFLVCALLGCQPGESDSEGTHTVAVDHFSQETGYAPTNIIVDAPGGWFGTVRLDVLEYQYAPIDRLYPFGALGDWWGRALNSAISLLEEIARDLR